MENKELTLNQLVKIAKNLKRNKIAGCVEASYDMMSLYDMSAGSASAFIIAELEALNKLRKDMPECDCTPEVYNADCKCQQSHEN